MIILWSESDMGIRDYDPDWLDETIERVEHKRDAMLSRVKTTVRNYDDHVGVPYSRIAEALKKLTEDHTRDEIITSLSALIKPLQIVAPKNKEIDPRRTKWEFHFWYNHIFASIRTSSWGPPSAMDQGKKIDMPIEHTPKLSHRLLKAVTKFRDLHSLGLLSVHVGDLEGGLDSYYHNGEWDKLNREESAISLLPSDDDAE